KTGRVRYLSPAMTASSERPSSLAGLCPVASGTVARLQAPSIAPGPGVVNVAVVTACQRHHCDGLSTPALWDRVATMARVLESVVSLGRQLAAAPTVDPQTLQQQGISLKRIDENPPLPTIRQGAADVRSVNMFYDADGLIRRVPLRVGVGERTLPGFDAALHRIVARAGLVV